MCFPQGWSFFIVRIRNKIKHTFYIKLITFLLFFINRAAQKLNIKTHKKKKHHEKEEERPQFPTNFSDVIRMNPPPAPPVLVRSAGRLQNPGTGKVSYLDRIRHRLYEFKGLRGCRPNTPPFKTTRSTSNATIPTCVKERKRQTKALLKST